MQKKPRYIDEIRITDDGGVMKNVIRHGESYGEDSIPIPGQVCSILYECHLENGTLVDSWKNYERMEEIDTDENGMRVVVGMGNIIEGWDMGLLTMRLGEKCDLVIKSKYAYGKEGRPPKIPPDATVIFTIELTMIGGRLSEKPKISQKSDEELIKDAETCKKTGNEKFGVKNYKKATEFYEDAIQLLDMISDDKKTEKWKELKITTHQNLAMCFLNLDQYREVIDNCDEAVIISEEKSAKAFYLMSQAYTKQQEYDKAIQKIKKAIHLQPNDRKLREEYKKLQELNKAQQTNLSSKFSGFIQGGIYNEKKSNVKKQRHHVKRDKLPAFDKENPQCYFDYQIGFDNMKEEQKVRGRVVFELFVKDVPHTVENFRVLCTGEKSAQQYYKDSRIHRVVPGFCIEGGDTSAAMDGKGGKSIYDEQHNPDNIHSKDGLFDDENVWLPHTHMGVISMLNDGKNTNGSRYVIATKDRIEYFDEKYVLFGRVIDGWEMMELILDNPRDQEKPKLPVIVHACGELKGDDKLGEHECTFLHMYERNVFEEDEKAAKRRAEKRAKRDKENKNFSYNVVDPGKDRKIKFTVDENGQQVSKEYIPNNPKKDEEPNQKKEEEEKKEAVEEEEPILELDTTDMEEFKQKPNKKK